MSDADNSESFCSRRTFLKVAAALGCSTSVVLSGGCVPPPTNNPPQPFTYAIPAEDSAQFDETQRLLIVRTQGRVYALSSSCTHEGCNVVLETKRKAFVCPCHGAVYAMDGAKQEAPAERDLDRHSLQRAENDETKVVVDLANKLRKGQPGFEEAVLVL